MQIYAGLGVLIGDNYASMLAMKYWVPTLETGSHCPVSQTGLSFDGWRHSLLVILIAGVSFCFASPAHAQAAPTKAAAAKPAPTKPAANPLSSIMKGKPVVPVVRQELPAALPEPAPP